MTVSAVAAMPPLSPIRRRDTHRLVPSRYLDDGRDVLAALADDDRHLADLFELDQATNDRILAENGRAIGIGPDELVFGVPYFRWVNAAFVHAHPLGSRFNGPERGAWYAGFELRTSQAEVAWHKSVELAEVEWFEQSLTYDDLLADFSADFHDLRPERSVRLATGAGVAACSRARAGAGADAGAGMGAVAGELAHLPAGLGAGPADAFADCLDPDSYVASQALAEQLLAADSSGVVYPSVRRAGGTCLACFRPALVYNVRRHARYRFIWSGKPVPVIRLEQHFAAPAGSVARPGVG